MVGNAGSWIRCEWQLLDQSACENTSMCEGEKERVWLEVLSKNLVQILYSTNLTTSLSTSASIWRSPFFFPFQEKTPH